MVTLYVSLFRKCVKITSEKVVGATELTSNQEEADSKIALHCSHALKETCKNVFVKSPSGEIDILVILLSTIRELDRVILDSGTGKYRQATFLSNFQLNDVERNALLGFHSSTGNDYVSSFFHKGKKYLLENLWETLITNIFSSWKKHNIINRP